MSEDREIPALQSMCFRAGNEDKEPLSHSLLTVHFPATVAGVEIAPPSH